MEEAGPRADNIKPGDRVIVGAGGGRIGDGVYRRLERELDAAIMRLEQLTSQFY